MGNELSTQSMLISLLDTEQDEGGRAQTEIPNTGVGEGA